MRFVLSLLMVLLAGTPAAAQAWKEYVFPAEEFAVQLPAPPALGEGLIYTADGTLVKERSISLEHEGIDYRVGVTGIAGADILREIRAAARATRERGEVLGAFDVNLCGELGEAVTVAQPDGTRLSNVIFYLTGRLYQIMASYGPDSPHSGRASAFQVSFRHLSMGEKSDAAGYSDGC